MEKEDCSLPIEVKKKAKDQMMQEGCDDPNDVLQADFWDCERVLGIEMSCLASRHKQKCGLPFESSAAATERMRPLRPKMALREEGAGEEGAGEEALQEEALQGEALQGEALQGEALQGVAVQAGAGDAF